MENDVFKDLDFHKEENYTFDSNFEKHYKIDYSLLKKGGIKPDFFVYKITKNKFC